MASSGPTADDAMDEESNPDEKPMSFLDHLEELRWTLVKSFAAFLITFIVSIVFFEELSQWLRWPLDRGLAEHPDSFKAITSSPMAVFSVYVTIPAIGGAIGALPFVLYFISQFVAPALTPKEKRLLVPGGIAGVLLFLAGAAFSYFLLIPSIMKISVELNVELGTELYWTIDKYYSMLLWIMLGMGAAFQFPLVIQVLIFLGLVTVQKLRTLRRIMFIVCCVIAAIITPTPDPFNMMMVATPLYLLYEAAIIVGATYTERRMRGREGREAVAEGVAKASRRVGWIVLTVLVLIAGAYAYVRFQLPDVGPPPALEVSATPELIERGRYLANHVSACMDCHSERDWTRFSGPLVPGRLGQGGEIFGRELGFPGHFIARNITPAGIGDWTDGELFRAITTGVTRDEEALFNVMPYANYGRMDPADIEAIIAYVRTLPPIENPLPEREVDFPVSLLINTIPEKAEPRKRPPSTDVVAYGEYLTNAAACIECHTRQERGRKVGEPFAGGFEFPFNGGGIVRSSNITPDETGIKSWTKAEFIARFKAHADATAMPPVDPAKGEMQTVMPWTMYAGMTEADLGAIYEYLRTVPAVSNAVERWSPPPPPAPPVVQPELPSAGDSSPPQPQAPVEGTEAPRAAP